MALNASNLPTVQRFKFEDYEEAPKWFATFLSTLNLFANPVYNILNGGVATQNLISPRTFTQVITATATTQFNFVNPLRVAPTSVLVGNVYVSGAPSTHPAVATQVMWHVSANKIYVDNVIGLTSGTTYALTLVVF